MPNLNRVNQKDNKHRQVTLTPVPISMKAATSHNNDTPNPSVKFAELDQPRKDLLNRLTTANVEEIEWPEEHVPKYQPKKATKHTQVTYNKKTERYVGTDSLEPVPEVDVIKIDLGHNVLYYCYHPTDKAYVRI